MKTVALPLKNLRNVPGFGKRKNSYGISLAIIRLDKHLDFQVRWHAAIVDEGLENSYDRMPRCSRNRIVAFYSPRKALNNHSNKNWQ